MKKFWLLLILILSFSFLFSSCLGINEQKEEEDPRADLAEMLLRYQAAKEAVPKLQALYNVHRDRMVKDTDEISIDKTYVADQ